MEGKETEKGEEHEGKEGRTGGRDVRGEKERGRGKRDSEMDRGTAEPPRTRIEERQSRQQTHPGPAKGNVPGGKRDETTGDRGHARRTAWKDKSNGGCRKSLAGHHREEPHHHRPEQSQLDESTPNQAEAQETASPNYMRKPHGEAQTQPRPRKKLKQTTEMTTDGIKTAGGAKKEGPSGKALAI
jgi:hypothetical protein